MGGTAVLKQLEIYSFSIVALVPWQMFIVMVDAHSKWPEVYEMIYLTTSGSNCLQRAQSQLTVIQVPHHGEFASLGQYIKVVKDVWTSASHRCTCSLGSRTRVH